MKDSSFSPDPDPSCAYHIVNNDNGLTLFTMGRVRYAENTLPSLDAERYVRPDLLPQWVQQCLVLLDAAGIGVFVAGVGRKLSENSYWIDISGTQADCSDWVLGLE